MELTLGPVLPSPGPLTLLPHFPYGFCAIKTDPPTLALFYTEKHRDFFCLAMEVYGPQMRVTNKNLKSTYSSRER